MKTIKILLVLSLSFFSSFIQAQSANELMGSERYATFVKDLKQSQVAVVAVQGMVCDFCARGIQKSFKKDKKLTKFDIDLSLGVVLLAYSEQEVGDIKAIKKKILSNGQNPVDFQWVNIK